MADDGFGFGSAAPIADDDESSPSSPTAPIDVPPASQARAELLHAPVPRRRAFLARLTPAALAGGCMIVVAFAVLSWSTWREMQEDAARHEEAAAAAGGPVDWSSEDESDKDDDRSS